MFFEARGDALISTLAPRPCPARTAIAWRSVGTGSPLNAPEYQPPASRDWSSARSLSATAPAAPVVRFSLSSWNRMTWPSRLNLVSNSTQRTPSAAALRMEASVFSGAWPQAGPGRR